MDLMEIRRALLQPNILTFGGLPVLINNARLTQYNSTLKNGFTTDNNYFITGWFDTGTTGSKSYIVTNIYTPTGSGGFAYLKLYNDKTGTSVDYWDIGRTGATRTFTSAGRFIVTTVYKPTAADFYLYDNTNHRYICKGKNVT